VADDLGEASVNGNGGTDDARGYTLAPGTTLEAAFAALDRLPPMARAAIYEAPIPFSPIDCETVMRRNGMDGEELAGLIRMKGREIMAAQERAIGLGRPVRRR